MVKAADRNKDKRTYVEGKSIILESGSTQMWKFCIEFGISQEASAILTVTV